MGATRPALTILRLAGIGALALALLWLIVRNAVIALLAQSAPQLALKFPPPSGLAISNAIITSSDPIPDAALKAKLRQALARAPISEAPFVAAASHARQRGDVSQASRYMTVAGERNRPKPSRRALLLAVYLQEARWGEAIDEAKMLGRNKQAEPVVTKMLLLLAQHPAAKQVLLEKFAKDPAWRRTVVRNARRAGASKAELAELQGDVR